MASNIKKITICGFGLIGGCMALDFQKGRNSKNKLVTAFDRPAVLKKLARNKKFNVNVEANFNKAVADSDVVILSAPHKANQSMLTKLSKIKSVEDTLIIDTGAVKKPIATLASKLKFADGTEFIPSHPMAGREKKGFENSSDNLFKNHAWYLDDEIKLSKNNQTKLDWMIKKLNANPAYIQTGLHDELVSEISHLPQLISTLLGAQVNPNLIPLAGPGLKSMLRLSGSPYSVWSEIIEQNREEIVKSLELYSSNMDMLIKKIKNKKSLNDIFLSSFRSYKCL